MYCVCIQRLIYLKYLLLLLIKEQLHTLVASKNGKKKKIKM